MRTRPSPPVYLYNSVEDEWPFISSLPKRDQAAHIKSSNRFADCSLFANARFPSFTLFSPIPISKEFLEYFRRLSRCECEIIVPKPASPSLCGNIAADRAVFEKLVTFALKNGGITLYAYSMTKEVYRLAAKLRRRGVEVHIPEGPEEQYVKTARYFGSKTGFRKSFAHLMPEGSIHQTVASAVKKAKIIFRSGSGVVIKTDVGSAGEGVFIFRKADGVTEETFEKTALGKLRSQPFIGKHPLVVEKYVDTSREKRCPFPSVECLIDDTGKITIPYYCNMIVTPEGEFYGMEMKDTVVSKRILPLLKRITREVAGTYRKSGFAGRFDIDMMYDGKTLYANESNTRVNGGTDTFMMARNLIGPSFFRTHYVFAHYIALDKSSRPSFPLLHTLCRPLLYDPKKKSGLIINSSSVIDEGGFSYIIIARSKALAFNLDNRLKELLTIHENAQ